MCIYFRAKWSTSSSGKAGVKSKLNLESSLIILLWFKIIILLLQSKI